MPFDETPKQHGDNGWCWWTPGEPESGLQGFCTREDRDAFSAGGDGPFRRVAIPGGRTIRQMPRDRAAQSR